MPRPIRKVADLLRELEKHRERFFIKIKSKDGNLTNILRVRRIGSTVQIWI